MADVPSPPPPPPTSQKPNLPMFYYGLVIVGTAALVLTVYNLIIIKWCTDRQGRPGQRARRLVELTASQSFQSRNLLSTFKYSKDSNLSASQDGGGSSSDYECPVCLSVFEEGEEVRQLPRCKHSFHAPCIDMWLYSHSDCPLCRAHVDPPLFCRRHEAAAPVARHENSREGLLESAVRAV